MLAPRLRQSMSYSLWFSISAFILDLSSCPPRFRAWTSGAGREAGEIQSDAVQRHEHFIPTYAGISGTRATQIDDSGRASEANIVLDAGQYYTYSYGPSGRFADETRPVNVAIPVILYLGLCA